MASPGTGRTAVGLLPLSPSAAPTIEETPSARRHRMQRQEAESEQQQRRERSQARAGPSSTLVVNNGTSQGNSSTPLSDALDRFLEGGGGGGGGRQSGVSSGRSPQQQQGGGSPLQALAKQPSSTAAVNRPSPGGALSPQNHPSWLDDTIGGTNTGNNSLQGSFAATAASSSGIGRPAVPVVVTATPAAAALSSQQQRGALESVPRRGVDALDSFIRASLER